MGPEVVRRADSLGLAAGAADTGAGADARGGVSTQAGVTAGAVAIFCAAPGAAGARVVVGTAVVVRGRGAQGAGVDKNILGAGRAGMGVAGA